MPQVLAVLRAQAAPSDAEEPRERPPRAAALQVLAELEARPAAAAWAARRVAGRQVMPMLPREQAFPAASADARTPAALPDAGVRAVQREPAARRDARTVPAWAILQPRALTARPERSSVHSDAAEMSDVALAAVAQAAAQQRAPASEAAPSAASESRASAHCRNSSEPAWERRV